MNNNNQENSMGKTVNIEYITIQIPKIIEVDGKTYPVTDFNISVIRDYEATKDESKLDNLSDYSFRF